MGGNIGKISENNVSGILNIWKQCFIAHNVFEN